MRLAVVAAVAAVLVGSAAADEWRKLHVRLSSMMPVDHVGATAGWALYDCTMATAASLSSKPEPKFTDADWTPVKDRPSLEQMAASAMAECADAEAKAAGVLPEPELAAIKASVLAVATDTIRLEREQRTYLRRE